MLEKYIKNPNIYRKKIKIIKINIFKKNKLILHYYLNNEIKKLNKKFRKKNKSQMFYLFHFIKKN